MESTRAQNEVPEETSSSPKLKTYRYSAASIPSPEDQLFELVQLSDIPMSKQLFDVIVELLRLNIPPSAILHVLKTLKAQATQTTLPPSLHTSRASSRAHTPPPTTQLNPTRSHKEAHKPKSERSHTSKQTATQPPVEVDKASRKHRHTSSSRPDASSQKPSSRSSEKLRSSTKGSSGGGGSGSSGGKVRGQAQDASKK